MRHGFGGGGLPDDMPKLVVQSEGIAMSVVNVLKQSGLAASTSEALRMLAQGAVRANGDRVSDKSLAFAPGEEVVIQFGRRKFTRVLLN